MASRQKLDYEPNRRLVVDRLRQRCLELGKAGAPMPSELQLSMELGVSRATVRDALTRLEAQGLLLRRKGADTIVNLAALDLRARIDLQVDFSVILKEAEVVIDQPVFRADLFDLIAGEPGNFLRAHYHPSFDGVEPSERRWDASLSADPLGWLVARLSDLEGVFAKSSAASFVPEEALRADADALRRVVDEVITVAELVLAQVRESNSQTTAAEARRPRGTATADGAESVGPGLCGPAPRTTAD